MKRLTVMLKPASSLCNMKCGYCFYSDVAAARHEASMGLMKRETAAAIVGNVYSELAPGDEITFAFQGGEPGLAGLDFFIFFTDEARVAAKPGVITNYAFQTNGLTIDAAWAEFFRKNDFLVGLSLDGDAALHDRNRVDRYGKGTYRRVMDAKKMLDVYGVRYNILCVLTAECARRAGRLWAFILTQNIRYIQFIPCLEPLDGGVHPAALTGDRFYRFYSALFPLWKAEADKNNMINVRLFEDVAGVYITGKSVTCGISGRCSPQIAVEADGGAYPCDFYMLDDYKAGNLASQTIREIFESVVSGKFYSVAPPQPEKCSDCGYRNWCGGGCKRLAGAVYGERCGMRAFLDERLDSLLETAGPYLNRI